MASSVNQRASTAVSRSRGGVSERSSGLNQRVIVAAALDIIAERGVDGLSMRLLSERLGVSLGATYRHVPDKHQLLRLVVVDLYARVQPPQAAADEFEQVKLVVVEIHDILAAYPGVAAYMGEHVASFISAQLAGLITEPLCAVGLPSAEANRIMFALVLLIAGHLLFRQPAGLEREAAAAFEEGVDLMLASAKARVHGEPGRGGAAPR